MRYIGFFLIFFTTLVGAACSYATRSPTSPSSAAGAVALTAENLAGTWSLVTLQPAGGAQQARPGTATYNVVFENGRISARADCNMCSGSTTLSGNSLTIGPALACTRAACPTMAFESTFESILSGDSTATIDGRALTLTSPRGALRFER